MAGIPTESPLVLRESLGSSHNRLTSAEDYEEALLSGYPPVGLLDAKNAYQAEQKGNRLPRPVAYPGLNVWACAHHGVSSSGHAFDPELRSGAKLDRSWFAAGCSQQQYRVSFEKSYAPSL